MTNYIYLKGEGENICYEVSEEEYEKIKSLLDNRGNLKQLKTK